jgi:hypothetical protein
MSKGYAAKRQVAPRPQRGTLFLLSKAGCGNWKSIKLSSSTKRRLRSYCRLMAVVGSTKLTRYMGWLEEHKTNGELTKGIIIAAQYDNRLHYALKKVKDVEVYLYV